MEVAIDMLDHSDHDITKNTEHDDHQMTANTEMADDVSLRYLLEEEKLNETNFLDWHRHLRIVLRFEGKMTIVEQPLPPRPEDDATTAMRNAWHMLNSEQKKIAKLMLSSMSPNLQKVMENRTAYDMLEELKRMFQPNASQELFDTLNLFFACKMSEGQSVGAHVLKMWSYVKQLKRLGHPLPNDVAVAYILKSLPRSYESFVMDYKMFGWKKTISEVYQMLVTTEKYVSSKTHEALNVQAGGVKKKNNKNPKGNGKGKGIASKVRPDKTSLNRLLTFATKIHLLLIVASSLSLSFAVLRLRDGVFRKSGVFGIGIPVVNLKVFGIGYPNATKRQLDFHHGGNVGEPSAPLANFFGPKRKKPTNFKNNFAGGVLENLAGAAADDATANISEESRGRKKSTNMTTRKRVTQRCGTPNLSPNSDGGVQSGGELLSSHSTEGLAINDDDPSLQNRKRRRPRKTVGESSNSHATKRLAANDNDPSQQPRKRGRRKKTVGPDAHGNFPSPSHMFDWPLGIGSTVVKSGEIAADEAANEAERG
ncbi:zinc finger, CCHC-type [Artemisia annua]|uniref:Zinc finger, CCHC-type n=1 Tax=Artemisia annua TaxID=35608 RepID=A0A2U1P1J2_ARTAN|nr:zinc finger, CCHC-type [Artemisia annua]